MTIKIWSDFACPYCYIGEARLRKAVERMNLDGVEYVYKAFELDPQAPAKDDSTAAQRMASKYGWTLEKAQKKVEEIDRLGHDAGINFRYEGVKYGNTFDAHRLMKLAEAEYPADVAQRLNFALFDAYFTKNLLLSDHDVLERVASDVNMDAKRVKEVLASDEFADRVRADEREAAHHSFHGVPYFVFDDEFVSHGALSEEEFKIQLSRVESHRKDVHAPHSEHSRICGPEGCKP